MNANPTHSDRTDDETETPPFSQKAAAARALCRYEFTELQDMGDYVAPHHDREGEVEALAFAMFPSSTVLLCAAESMDLDDEDGAAPRGPRTDRAFLFDAAFPEGDDESADLQFEVVAEWTNSYDDDRVTLETPAPWDVPDEFEGDDPNEVIKAREWDEAHYSFNDDDRAAPPAARNDTWTLDAEAVEDLREDAEAEGYEWVENTDEADEDEDETSDRETLGDLLTFLTDGDRVTVHYEKKNGNGRSTYAGEVTTHTRVYTDRSSGYDMGTGRTWGLVFEDDGGKTKRVKCDDEGTLGLFSTGHYPFMGEVVAVEVEVSTPEWDLERDETTEW